MANSTVTPGPVTVDQDIDGQLTSAFLFGTLDGANSTFMNYLNFTPGFAQVIEVIGTGFTYNQAGTEVTGGTISQINILKDFSGTLVNTGTFTNLAMNAASLDAAVRNFQLTSDPAQWHAIFGLNNYNVSASQWNLNFRGFAGDDTVQGGDGNDQFSDFDGGDVDLFNGGNGSDNVYVGKGVSTLNGGAGFDLASFLNLTSPTAVGMQINTTTGAYSSTSIAGISGTLINFDYITATNFNDTINGRASAEWLVGEAGRDQINGQAGNDHLNGGDGNDSLLGGDGNDIILGGIGNDVINGGIGNDQITGEGGGDTLAGGTGADVFIYTDIAHSAPALRDRLTDFVHLTDDIRLTAIDANANAGGNQAFTFIGTSAFGGVAGQLRYGISGANAVVSGDVNGDSVADFQILLNNVAVLSSLDFFL